MSCSSTRQLAADALGQNIFAGTTKLVERIRTCGHGHQKRFYGPGDCAAPPVGPVEIRCDKTHTAGAAGTAYDGSGQRVIQHGA
ncbi:hypothetical protein AWC32_23410 [Mycobacterium xenopi]|uniref:Uncharacterized protein n=1 Tax=Mycobacterium xenopi 4042 TaxID=1299334 RepID=X8CEB7_MYCXE|nr:hypothetical protein I553_1612 [Mycobacterium xenopi 4042]ORX21454.1 hypothetical protein AWC32_23410 [Mycobacterium xenopi]